MKRLILELSGLKVSFHLVKTDYTRAILLLSKNVSLRIRQESPLKILF